MTLVPGIIVRLRQFSLHTGPAHYIEINTDDLFAQHDARVHASVTLALLEHILEVLNGH